MSRGLAILGASLVTIALIVVDALGDAGLLHHASKAQLHSWDVVMSGVLGAFVILVAIVIVSGD